MPETNQDSPQAPSARRPSRTEAFWLRWRLWVNVSIHAVLFTVALLLAFLVRLDAGVPGGGERDWFSQSFLPYLPLFVLVKLAVFGRMKLFRTDWRYVGIRDVAGILLAAWTFVLLLLGCLLVFHFLPNLAGRKVPYVGDYFAGFLLNKGVIVLDFLATVFLVCTVRLAFRLYHEELRPVAPEGIRRVLIVGAGNAAEAVIREIQRMRSQRYRVIGLVDDDPVKRDLVIHGVQVLGPTGEIRGICDDYDVDEIIIAIPSAAQKQMRRVIELCSGTKLKFQSLPGVTDLIDGKVTVSQIRPVDINDLLGREAVALDTEAVARFLQGRRVLITGAGGSIGSEMWRQVCRFGPAELVLLEQAENPLFEIEGELRRDFQDIPTTACLCDIYDRDRVLATWSQFRPEVVIHAAAHKHVPLTERNPCEAIKNNIFGTKNVADASCRFGVAEFVMISTDKAVNPSSIMGAAKRVAEIYTQARNERGGSKTKFKAVRFGNVLGSSGSVVPIFRKQIAAGGPVRVTHPEMKRYFMTIPEAAQLVLQAAATGEGGQIFLLDMGEPVRIVDLARQMITLSGFRPGEDIDIVFSGIRPGEKLFEELRTEGEDIEPTVHPKVSIWKSRPTDWEHVEDAIEHLRRVRNCDDHAEIVAALRRIVPEYEPRNVPTRKTDPPSPESPADGPPAAALAEEGTTA